MNLELLDRRLRTLSESEKRYKKGEKNPQWDIVTLSGTKIPCFKMELLPKDPEEKRSRPDASFRVVIPELNMSVNQNSRFSPVPMHTHNYVELSYVYSGTCPETVGSQDIILKKGQVLIIDTDSPHSVGWLDEDDIMINVLLSREYLHKNLFNHLSRDSILSDFFVNAMLADTAHDRYLLFHSENDRRIPIFFQELLCECCEPSINSSDIITNLIGLIIAELINVREDDLMRVQMKSGNIPVIPIIHYIEANYRTCTRESVAKLFHISEKYLTSLLKKNTGMSYKQLIQSQKMKVAAKLLLNTDISIERIIEEAGYENATFFYRKFREEYGMSPKEYREKKEEQ